MGLLSPILRNAEGGVLIFNCPGCKTTHAIQHGAGAGPRWAWDGNVERPTFSPSVLVRSGHFAKHHDGQGCWCTYYAEHPDEVREFECAICHSFVRDGQIQFLSDCTHALAGQTVPLAPFPVET